MGHAITGMNRTRLVAKDYIWGANEQRSMKIKFLFFLLFVLSVLGCVRRHTATADLGDHLYVEYFNINPAGVEEVYLTDSVNFRVYIGKYDTEHQKVGCKIKGDTIVVFKNQAGEGRMRIMMDHTQLSKDSLTKNKVTSTEPLFEFR